MAKHADTPDRELSGAGETKTSPTAPNYTDTGASELSKVAEGPTPAVGSERPRPKADEVIRSQADPKQSTEGKARRKRSDAAERQVNNLSDVENPPVARQDSSTVEEEPTQIDQRETDEHVDDRAETAGRKRFSSVRLAIAVSAAVVVALACLAGWLGYRTYETRQAQAQREQLVAVARQGVLNLTTIDYTKVNADVQRILDSSTGAFHDDFQKRTQPFIDVVKKAQSKSEGTITAAGLESQDGDQARVLVAVTVKTSIVGAPDQDPRWWRMRIGVQKTGDGPKVSDVQFVP